MRFSGYFEEKNCYCHTELIASSINSFMVNIYSSSVPMFSKIWGWWYSILTI